MGMACRNGDQVLQCEIDCLVEKLNQSEDARQLLQEDNRRLWSQLQLERQQVNALQARVDHLTDEANRWRPGQ